MTVRRDNVEWHKGRDANRAGVPFANNPYSDGSNREDSRFTRWNLGWQEAEAARDETGKPGTRRPLRLTGNPVRENMARQRAEMAAIADAENPATVAVRTIDATPTWAAILPLLRAAIENGTPEGRRIAWEELARMAQAADNWNASAKAQPETIS